MKLLAFDPSGNMGNEGYGTTGYCIMKDRVPMELGEIRAKDYESEVQYWAVHQDLIESVFPDAIVMEGYRLYHHKDMKAETQANSELQTPQLIGAIKLVAYNFKIPVHIQYAAEVKSRWNESVLVRKRYLDELRGRYYFNGEPTSSHKRDSLKHALHWWRYKQ